MRVFKYLFFALLFLVVTFFAYGFFFLDDKVQVSRSITIDRPAKMIFKTVNSMQTFNEWSPWAKIDPNAKYQYKGPNKGIGSEMSWAGNEEVGSGSQKIIESIPYQKIKTELYFDGQGDDPSWATIGIEEMGDSAKVSWTFEVDFDGDIVKRYFGIMMDKMLGPYYESGLNNLKSLVEAQTVYDFSNFNIENVESNNILYVTSSSNSNQEASAALAAAYDKLTDFMTTNDIAFAGMPIAITRDWKDGFWEFDAAIPVSIDALEGETNDIQLGKTYNGRAIKYIQKGAYDKAEASYALMDAYIEEHELTKNGMSWEVYANDPATVTESEILTFIYQPIK